MVCTVDHLASSAGVDLLRAGGSAADAAVGASAVLAVTTQHMCGLGGDLFALVHDGAPGPHALSSAGWAGAGSDGAALRAQGFAAMPFRGDIRSVTVPGCVDGWLALHARFGRLPLATVLEAARQYAAQGFPASPLLARAAALIAPLPGAEDYRRPAGLRAGDVVRRPSLAAVLDEVVADGRDGFYGGTFGRGLLALGERVFTAADLARPVATWGAALSRRAWGHDVWTVGPPSQGYLVPASGWIAERLDLPDDPVDPAWPHLLSEAARWAGHDRPAVLFDGADGSALLAEDRLRGRLLAIDPDRRGAPPAPGAPGGTIYLCAVDAAGMGVSLIQSNAAGWGAHLVVSGTGVFLQNRGVGFSLALGHPAELAPGRRPPHTLAPALVTRPDGTLTVVLGTMGGDIQPQVVLQLLARLLRHGESPGAAVDAPRWFLGDGGFDTWTGAGPQATTLERGSPAGWARGLAARGHRVAWVDRGSAAGHAQAIVRHLDGTLSGAADPRALTGSAAGW